MGFGPFGFGKLLEIGVFQVEYLRRGSLRLGLGGLSRSGGFGGSTALRSLAKFRPVC